MEYISGIARIQRKAGAVSVRSEKSSPATELSISTPTKIRAGAVAKAGTAVKTGARKTESRNNNPVTTEASPVLAPASTPDDNTPLSIILNL